MEKNKDREAAEAFTQLLAIGIGSAISELSGYFIGKNRYKGWDHFVKKYDERLNHLTYFRVIIPIVSLNITKLWRVYREGINAYLFGLSNASIPMVFKCLECGLRSKYNEIETGNSDKMRAWDLIEWANRYLKDKKEIAHGFRILRNILHERMTVEEQDALECIRHVSEALNLLYPFSTVNFRWKCAFCEKSYTTVTVKDNYYIGNSMNMWCDSCQRVSKVTMYP